MVGPAAKKAAVAHLESEHKFSERRACRLLRLHRGTKRYRRQKVDDPKLVERLKELAARRRKFGYRRLHTLLKREGFKVNQKKIRRIYREQNLSIKLRKKTKVRSIVRVPIEAPTRANERWSMDFVSDQLGPTGRRFRTLTIVDEFVVPEGLVWGLVWSLSEENLSSLDQYEGHPTIYRRREMDIQMGPEKKITAWVYEVLQKKPLIEPSAEYLKVIVSSAAEVGLPSEYTASIAKFGKK